MTATFPLPLIKFPSGGSNILQFVSQPRLVPFANLAATRHNNVASSGAVERIWERTDQFFDLTMEWMFSGADAAAWDVFMNYALQGGTFDYYPDSTVGTLIICTLEDNNWVPGYKQLGAYTFKAKLRVSPAFTTPATAFGDTFNRANGDLGQDWVYSTRRSFSGLDTFGSAVIASNRLSFTRLGANNGGSELMTFIPRSIIPALYLRPQFAQMRYVSTAGVFTRTGPSVGMTLQVGPDTGYYLAVDEAGVSKLIQVSIGGTSTLLQTLDSPTTLDILKIGVVYGTASNLLYCYRNNVLMVGANPYVDSSVGRPVICGWPGIASFGLDLTGGGVWDDFFCGVFTP